MNQLVTASYTKHKKTTLERIEKYISKDFFTDVNLFGKLYPDRRDLTSIKHWMLPGGVGGWEKWSFKDVVAQKEKFAPAKIGDVYGQIWSTHWFWITFEVPAEWNGREVRLHFKSQSESMLWSMDGLPLQGLSSGTSHQPRPEYVLSRKWDFRKESKTQEYLIEMVCSRMFGVGKGGLINPPNLEEKFTLEVAEIRVLDTDIYSLYIDLQILHDLAKHLEEDPKSYFALYAGNQIINNLVKDDVKEAHAVSKQFFSNNKNGDSMLTLALIGNCHIDSAWLWPFSETKRKCARSWSAALKLMDDYPEMIFVCSQAQQFDWVKTHYPSLFDQIKKRNKDGRFVHVGATWVEMDGLLPSGESFIRQFLYGQKFYNEEFGSESTIFWLPDTFGYSGQLPQICKHFDISFFLTQKLSWSLVNKFPNHTFHWEGIDGSTVITHFPPGDSYEMKVNVEEALKTERNSTDKGRVNTAAFLYGYGDGGGGPTQDMLEKARRLKNVDGCPKMEHMNPVKLFDCLKSQERNLSRWVGELYLELHNGTYTSQAKTKWYNRRCEFQLRGVEILMSIALSKKALSPERVTQLRNMCEDAWKKVLLNQFHDVLPGSSIGMVYVDSDQIYEEALEICRKVEEECLKALSEDSKACSNDGELSILNLFPWETNQVIEVKATPALDQVDSKYIQVSMKDKDKRFLSIQAPPMSFTRLNIDHLRSEISVDLKEARLLTPGSVLIEMRDVDISLENKFVYAYFTHFGEMTKLAYKGNKKHSQDVFISVDGRCGKGNVLTVYDDVPLFWDAWDVMDYHVETRKEMNTKQNEKLIKPLVIVDNGPLRVELKWEMSLGSSSHLVQRIILSDTDPFVSFENEVDWYEAHKFLKVEFETTLLAREATYEIQFGHLSRPTHQNTSWDSAKYEVIGHKWANISQFDLGLSILNDSKYGWSARGSTLILSLLRAPKAPDDNCDMGKHVFKYAAMPHEGPFQTSGTIKAAYEFNYPIAVKNGLPKNDGITSWLKVSNDGVMIEAVKVAEKSSSALIIRLYEVLGASYTETWLETSFKIHKAWECYGNEQEIKELIIIHPESQENSSEAQSKVKLAFTPFSIKTVKLSLK